MNEADNVSKTLFEPRGPTPHLENSKEADFDAIRRRLASARDAIARSFTTTQEERLRILRERARALAIEPEETEVASQMIEIVEFVLSHEKYGIEVSYVDEVFPLKELTPLPCTPPFVRGLFNARGKIISVIDIRRFFDLQDVGFTDLSRIIVVRSGEMTVGILADEVVGVGEIASSEIQARLPTLTGIRAEYLLGVTKDRLVILDTAKLLADRKIIVHEEVGI